MYVCIRQNYIIVVRAVSQENMVTALYKTRATHAKTDRLFKSEKTRYARHS